MTPSELRTLGEHIFGKHWQTKLARALPVDARTIRRWLTGKTKPHRAVVARIRGMAAGTTPIQECAARRIVEMDNEREGV